MKANEVVKQLEIAPIAAIIELSLMQKLMEAVKELDGGNTGQLASLVDTFKRLTRDSIINTVVKTDDKANANAPSVVVQMLQFQK